MALITNISLQLDGTIYPLPKGIADLSTSAIWDDESSQASIETESFELVNEAARYVINEINNGFGIFQGIVAKLIISDQDNTTTIFDGYIDMTEGFSEIEPEFLTDNDAVKILCKFKTLDSRDSIREMLDGITYSYLESIGVFKGSDYEDLNYAYVKKIDFTEIVTTSIAIYIVSKEIPDTIRRLSDISADITAFLATGFTGPIAAAIALALKTIIEIAYAIAIIILLIRLITSIIAFLIPPTAKHKVSSLRKLIVNPLEYFGITLQTNITELSEIYYLPSVPSDAVNEKANKFFPILPKIKKGIPNPTDTGYLVNEMFSIVMKFFNAKMVLKDNKLYLYRKGDPFWKQTSTFVMRNALKPTRKYNTDELFQTRLVSFSTDPSDVWTIENYKGTSYEVKTEPKTIKDPRLVTIKGLDRIDLGVGLGNRKDTLTVLEQLIRVIAEIADTVAGALGLRTSFQQNIKNRAAYLKVSDPYHTMARLIPMENGLMKKNHREIVSAKAVYENYKIDSFVVGEDAQAYIYEAINIDFTIVDYKKLLENNYFKDFNGESGRVDELEWNIWNDKATIKFRIFKRYENNLKEIFIEPS